MLIKRIEFSHPEEAACSRNSQRARRWLSGTSGSAQLGFAYISNSWGRTPHSCKISLRPVTHVYIDSGTLPRRPETHPIYTSTLGSNAKAINIYQIRGNSWRGLFLHIQEAIIEIIFSLRPSPGEAPASPICSSNLRRLYSCSLQPPRTMLMPVEFGWHMSGAAQPELLGQSSVQRHQGLVAMGQHKWLPLAQRHIQGCIQNDTQMICTM